MACFAAVKDCGFDLVIFALACAHFFWSVIDCIVHHIRSNTKLFFSEHQLYKGNEMNFQTKDFWYSRDILEAFTLDHCHTGEQGPRQTSDLCLAEKKNWASRYDMSGLILVWSSELRSVLLDLPQCKQCLISPPVLVWSPPPSLGREIRRIFDPYSQSSGLASHNLFYLRDSPAKSPVFNWMLLLPGYAVHVHPAVLALLCMPLVCLWCYEYPKIYG